MTFKRFVLVTFGGTVTALTAAAGYRWRSTEIRRAELNKEYAELLEQMQNVEATKKRLRYALRDKENATAAMKQTVNNIWSDRLTRYVETNENLLAYILALPESLGVLHGLTNHYNYMSAVAREFINFNVSCVKIHILTLLLEHAKRICSGHYCQQVNNTNTNITTNTTISNSNNIKSGSTCLAESDVLNNSSDRYVEHKMKSVWTTLRELYNAEPIIVAVCDSFLLDTTPATSIATSATTSENDPTNNTNPKTTPTQRNSVCDDDGERRIPSSLHELSETFLFCLEELEHCVAEDLHVKQDEAKLKDDNNDNNSRSSNNTRALVNSSNTILVNETHTHDPNSINDTMTDNNENRENNIYDDTLANRYSNDDTDNTHGSVAAEIVQKLINVVQLDERTAAQRAMNERRREHEQRIKCERGQLKTHEDVEAAILYSEQLLSSINEEVFNNHKGEEASKYTMPLTSSFPLSEQEQEHDINNTNFNEVTSSNVISNNNNNYNNNNNNSSSTDNATVRNTRANFAIHRAMQQIKVWQEAATAYLVQSQSLEILDCYNILLAETLTHVHDINEQEPYEESELQYYY